MARNTHLSTRPTPDTSPVGALYTPAEVAALLKVTPRTVQAWIRAGRLPARRYGRLYRVRAADLARFGRETSVETSGAGTEASTSV
jgi:excisionase family DNA binding protein